MVYHRLDAPRQSGRFYGGRIRPNPGGKRAIALFDNAAEQSKQTVIGGKSFVSLDLRFTRIVRVICGLTLSRHDWSIVDQLEQMLPISCNDGQLLPIFAHSLELVVEAALDLLARDRHELYFCRYRFCFDTDELLLKLFKLFCFALFAL